MTLIVSENIEEVENNLKTGNIFCPLCNEPLRPHGHARTRFVNSLDKTLLKIRPRRGRCSSCGNTHVLLPDILLVRRAHTVEVIGLVLLDKSQGNSLRSISDDRNLSFSTVKGWIKRFRLKADQIKNMFLFAAFKSDPNLNNISPSGSPFKDAINAIGIALMSLRLRIGEISSWSTVSMISKGELLFNTS